MLKGGALLAALGCLQNASAVNLEGQIQHQHRAEGIFGRMIDQVTAPERMEEEQHKAT